MAARPISRALDVGCSGGETLAEAARLLPDAELVGTDVADYLSRTEQQRIQALLNVDEGRFNELHADGYLLCNPTGAVWAKPNISGVSPPPLSTSGSPQSRAVSPAVPTGRRCWPRRRCGWSW